MLNVNHIYTTHHQILSDKQTNKTLKDKVLEDKEKELVNIWRCFKKYLTFRARVG